MCDEVLDLELQISGKNVAESFLGLASEGFRAEKRGFP